MTEATIKQAAEALAVRALTARTTKAAFGLEDLKALGTKTVGSAKDMWNGLGEENQRTIGYGLGGAALGGTIGAMTGKRREDGSSDWLRNAAIGALAGGAAGAGGNLAYRNIYGSPTPAIVDPRTNDVNRIGHSGLDHTTASGSMWQNDGSIPSLPGTGSTTTGTYTPQSYAGQGTPFLAPGNHGLAVAGAAAGAGVQAGVNHLRTVSAPNAGRISDGNFLQYALENGKDVPQMSLPVDHNAPLVRDKPTLVQNLRNMQNHVNARQGKGDFSPVGVFDPAKAGPEIQKELKNIYGGEEKDFNPENPTVTPSKLLFSRTQRGAGPDPVQQFVDYTRATGGEKNLQNIAQNGYQKYTEQYGAPRQSYADFWSRGGQTGGVGEIENPYTMPTGIMGAARRVGRLPIAGALAGGAAGTVADAMIGTGNVPDDRLIQQKIDQLNLMHHNGSGDISQ